MKKLVLNTLILFAFFLAEGAIAQQDALYSQYLFNPYAINPAYAGTRNSVSALLLHRTQWAGIDGAPRTNSFAIHSPIKRHNLAWGINLLSDEFGPTANTMFGASAGYHLKFKKSTLAFGLRGGIINTSLNRNLLKFKDADDPFAGMGTTSDAVPTVDFGLYFYQSKFFVGLSFNHLASARINFNELPGTEDLFFRRHVMLNAGYIFNVKDNFLLKPSFLIRTAEGTPTTVDLSLNTLLYKKVWLGLAFRGRHSLVALLEINITDFLRVGYAFDHNYSPLGGGPERGSHEVLIGFDFNVKKKNVESPRYF